MKGKKDSLLRAILALGEISERKLDTEARAIDFVASTDAEDGHGTVIEQSWELKRYKANPVVLFEHGYASWSGEAEDKIPIAHAERVRVEDGKLKVRVVFPAPGRSELSDSVWTALEDMRLNAVSVGFRPGKVTREELDGGRERYRLAKNTLFEISIVAVPSNPECVAERSMLERLSRVKTECSVEVCLGPDCDDDDCICACHGGRSVPSTDNPARESAATEIRMDKHLIEILSKRYSCPATEADVLAAIDTERRSHDAASAELANAKKDLEVARTENVVLKPRSVIALACIAALGLAENAGEADVTKAIVGLNSRAAKADELEPKVKQLETDIEKHEQTVAEREVQFLVTRGKDYGFSFDEKSKKALAAYRKADPKGFADEYKPALDGLRAMDDPKMFKNITGTEGSAAATTEESRAIAPEPGGEEAEFERRVDAWMDVNAKRGRPILRSVAMGDVVRGKDKASC